jgi:hypothetical protein
MKSCPFAYLKLLIDLEFTPSASNLNKTVGNVRVMQNKTDQH